MCKRASGASVTAASVRPSGLKASPAPATPSFTEPTMSPAGDGPDVCLVMPKDADGRHSARLQVGEVPDADRVIDAARGEPAAVGADGDGPDLAGVALRREAPLAVGNLPTTDAAVGVDGRHV